ncbi:MAG: hypothetical protein HY822_10040 [Acidobacteria bacterium]|nr:hypothetical protein [Acidobacteriota bacterium]
MSPSTITARTGPAPDAKVHSIMLLAPAPQAVPPTFRKLYTSSHGHSAVLDEIRRLRGTAYLKDGAISASQLTEDGRHVQEADAMSWHVVGWNRDCGVVGCARYWEHADPVRFKDLGVSRSALAGDPVWGPKVREAVERGIAQAADSGLAYVEVGGWAVAEKIRGTPEALRIALSGYALARSLGACIGITTATVRHRSSTILRRIGGRRLGSDNGEELPVYFDPQYDCDMEIVCFDSRRPDPRFEDRIEEMRHDLVNATVLCAEGGLWNLDQAVRETERAPRRVSHLMVSALQAV